MFLDRPMLLRSRTLPGMPVGSQVLPVPFADLVATALGVRAVALAKRAQGVRLVIAVCEGCQPCELFGTSLAATAMHTETRLTMLYPGRSGDRTVPGGVGDAGPAGEWGAGVGWPERFVLADLEPFAGGYAGAVRASRQRARQLDAVDGNVPGPAGNHGQYALAVHLVEALSVLPDPPATIWLPYDPATCAALDGAVRLLGWPSVVAAVAATAPQPVGWPVSALDPYLCRRATAGDRVEPFDRHARTAARQILADAGMPGDQVRHGDGLAGLLTAHDTGRPVSGDLALVPLPSLAAMYQDPS